MIPKLFKLSAFSLLIFISFSSVCRADQGETESGYLSTGSTGTITGTPPVIKNAEGNTGKVDFKKDDKRAATDELDIGDTVSLAWLLQDNEGDADATLASVVWTCDHPVKGTRVLATQVDNYTISSADLGCNIGVSLQPQTQTGDPLTSQAINITDISTYDDNDNITDGPVNPHAINITDYIVAPGTTQSKTVPANLILNTGWSGAKVQVETDNESSQITWTSSDENVATVSSDGIVTFIKKGAVTITAKNDEVSAGITFDPEEFFILTTESRNWEEAKTWCEDQGYTMPSSKLLSTAANKREIPSNAIWQEWGDISEEDAVMGSNVVWSSSEWSTGEPNAYYLYFSDGHISSNSETREVGTICME